MNIREQYANKYLKAADLGKGRPVVTIANVTVEEVGQKDGKPEKKPIVHFVGKSLGLVLNKTNAQMIEEIAGSFETDNWRGVAIGLYATKVSFQGSIKDAIRVEPPRGGQGFSTPSPTPFTPPAAVRTLTAPAGFTTFAESVEPGDELPAADPDDEIVF